MALVESADSFIFVFRGSQDTADFKVDAESQFWSFGKLTETRQLFGGDGPNVPSGFFKPFESMW